MVYVTTSFSARQFRAIFEQIHPQTQSLKLHNFGFKCANSTPCLPSIMLCLCRALCVEISRLFPTTDLKQIPIISSLLSPSRQNHAAIEFRKGNGWNLKYPLYTDVVSTSQWNPILTVLYSLHHIVFTFKTSPPNTTHFRMSAENRFLWSQKERSRKSYMNRSVKIGDDIRCLRKG